MPVPPFAAWVRTDWRHRWWSLIVLGLLVGVTGGMVMTAAAGARRTATSLDRLASVSNSSDVLIDPGDAGLAAAEEIERLPSVAEAAPVTLVFAIVDGVSFDVGLFLPRTDGVGTTLERDRLLRGRRAQPDRADEVTINEPMADLAHLDVGDRIDIRTLTPEQVDAEDYDPARGPVVPVTITGVTRGPGDLSARPEGNIAATPALYPRLAGEVDEFALYVAVRLRPGATVDGLTREVRTIEPTEGAFDLLSARDRTNPARQTISTLATGLALLAAVAGVAVAVSIAQAVGRHVDGAAGDDATLEALGLTRRQRARAFAATVLPMLLVGPVVAVAVAVFASPLTPIGLARRAEPDPGIRLDPLVLALAAVATAAVVAASAAAAGVRATRERRARPAGSGPA